MRNIFKHNITCVICFYLWTFYQSNIKFILTIKPGRNNIIFSSADILFRLVLFLKIFCQPMNLYLLHAKVQNKNNRKRKNGKRKVENNKKHKMKA